MEHNTYTKALSVLIAFVLLVAGIMAPTVVAWAVDEPGNAPRPGVVTEGPGSDAQHQPDTNPAGPGIVTEGRGSDAERQPGLHRAGSPSRAAGSDASGVQRKHAAPGVVTEGRGSDAEHQPIAGDAPKPAVQKRKSATGHKRHHPGAGVDKPQHDVNSPATP